MSEETTTVNTDNVQPQAYEFQNKGSDGWKLFKSAYNEDPSTFQDVYADAIKSKVLSKINDRRTEIGLEINDALKTAEESQPETTTEE
jgi:hypothetical protein